MLRRSLIIGIFTPRFGFEDIFMIVSIQSLLNWLPHSLRVPFGMVFIVNYMINISRILFIFSKLRSFEQLG